MRSLFERDSLRSNPMREVGAEWIWIREALQR
jgi:hypothetical protein